MVSAGMIGAKEDQNNGKLSWRTKVAYAGGDVACNVIFGMVGTLLTLFYTDYVGINPATVGMVMLISRLFDGFSDLVMGIVYRKDKFKMGKIQAVDFMDERSVCAVCSLVVYGAAYDGNDAGHILICDL